MIYVGLKFFPGYRYPLLFEGSRKRWKTKMVLSVFGSLITEAASTPAVSGPTKLLPRAAHSVSSSNHHRFEVCL